MSSSPIPLKFQSSPIFRLSTLRNEDVLISESLEHLPPTRMMMIMICLIIGIGTFINLIAADLKYKSTRRNGIFYRRLVPLILFLNIVFHVAHYAHNIYDPAGYFEPKRLYSKVFFSEMEKTFFFNFPLSFLFLIATWRLLSACTTHSSNSFHMLTIVTFYCFMSMISGGHYTFEPPWNYSLIYNITIAGETIVALLLLIIALFVYQSNSTKPVNYRYTRLSVNDGLDVDAQISVVQERQRKSKMSDNE